MQLVSSISTYRIVAAEERPWITMDCSRPAAWTTNRSLLVASRVRPFQEDRQIPARPYPELRTWMVVRSGVISVFPTQSVNAPASPDIRPTTWLCPACLPSTNSIPAPIQPTIAMTTTHIHQLWLTRPPSTRRSSASEDHPQAPVVTHQPPRINPNLRVKNDALHRDQLLRILIWSEWKLPLRGRITYRHCRQPKLPSFLYSSNTTSWRLMRRANNNNYQLLSTYST